MQCGDYEYEDLDGYIYIYIVCIFDINAFLMDTKATCEVDRWYIKMVNSYTYIHKCIVPFGTYVVSIMRLKEF